MSGPTDSLETLHAAWCRAFEAFLAGEITAAAFPVGYEHAYAAAGERLLLVCPWHWRQYSHYQFWELAGAAFLGRQAGFRDWALVTNDAWTPWILPALRALYGSVIAGDLAAVVDRAREWLTAEASPPSLPADRPVGCIDLGDVDRATTTVRLKERVGQTASDLLWRGAPVESWLPNVVLRPAFHAVGQTMIFTKGFRNPDPIHEAKMMAGRGFLCPPGWQAVVVVDGRLGAAPDLIARSGATVCTPDRLTAVLSDAAPVPARHGASRPICR